MIITTGIDLSSGSVIALAAVVAASPAQTSDSLSPMFPALVNLPAVIPICAGIGVGLLCGLTNGFGDADRYPAVYRHPRDDGFGARSGAVLHSGQPDQLPLRQLYGDRPGAMPVIIFFVIAAVFHIALKHTRYGKYVYAIGGNMTSAKVSGINVNKYLVIVYTIAGALSGLAGVVLAARVSSGQSSMGMSYELDAIAAAVIGGSSLMGGVGRITGTLIGAMILGLIKSGFTFVGVDAYVQDIIKGIIIVAAVTIDMRRNRKNTNLINGRQRRRMPLPPVLSRNKQNTPRRGSACLFCPRCASCTVSPLPLSIRQGPRVACGFWSRMNTPSFGKFSPRWLAEKGALSSRCSRGWRSRRSVGA